MATAATAIATPSPTRRPPRNVRNILISPMSGNWQAVNEPSRLQFRLLAHDHLGAHRNAFVEVAHIGIDQPEAAGGYRGTDRIRPVGAVDAIDCGAEIHRAGAERDRKSTRLNS